jgi:hypothetical protein
VLHAITLFATRIVTPLCLRRAGIDHTNRANPLTIASRSCFVPSFVSFFVSLTMATLLLEIELLP